MKQSNQNLFAFLAIFTSVFCLQPSLSQAQSTEVPIKDTNIGPTEKDNQTTSCIAQCQKAYENCIEVATAEITQALERVMHNIRTESYGSNDRLPGFIVEYMLLEELNFGDGKSAIGQCGEALSSCIASCGT